MLNYYDTCAMIEGLCGMLSAVILQLKQQREINETARNEKNEE